MYIYKKVIYEIKTKNFSEYRGGRDGLTDSYFWRSSYALKYPPREKLTENETIYP